MYQAFLVKNVKSLRFSPIVQCVPVDTVVFNIEIRLWCSLFGHPLERQQRDIALAHDVLTKVFDAVIWHNVHQWDILRVPTV